jgi:hypothetical protein
MKNAKMQSTVQLGSWIPLVFYICKNDLPLTVGDGQLVLFADDINLLIT